MVHLRKYMPFALSYATGLLVIEPLMLIYFCFADAIVCNVLKAAYEVK